MTARSGSEATDLYTVEVDRDDGWWIIHVLALDVVTQAGRWSEVERMARGVVIAVLDLDEDADVPLEIVPVFDDDAGRLLQTADELESRAKELMTSAADAKRSAIRSLKAGGWTLQGIAAGLGLSYQRIEQLLRSEKQQEPIHGSTTTPGSPPPPVIENAAVPTQSAKPVTTGASRPLVDRSSAVTGRFVTRSAAQRRADRATDGRRRSSG